MSVQVTEVQKALGGIDYPVGRDQLVSHAESNGADDEVLEKLRGIPDRQYDGPNAVMHELKGELGGPTDS